MTKKKLQAFTEWVRRTTHCNPDVTDYLVFRQGDDVGVIYCVEASEENDQHCEECLQEVMAFKPRNPVAGFERHYVACVGPTKFDRIRGGWRDSVGLDLNSVEFVND